MPRRAPSISLIDAGSDDPASPLALAGQPPQCRLSGCLRDFIALAHPTGNAIEVISSTSGTESASLTSSIIVCIAGVKSIDETCES